MTPIVDFASLSWRDIEQRLETDCRVVIPLGATEEHGALSVCTDTLFVERVTRDACRESGVLVTPALPFGCSAFATNFPGTISLRTAVMCMLVEDIIDCLYRQGFRRMLFVTGHGGNEVVTGVLSEAQLDRNGLVVHYVNAWGGIRDRVAGIDRAHGYPDAEHAAWPEAFDFARVGDVPAAVVEPRRSPDFPSFPLNPRTARTHLGEGVVGGATAVGDGGLMQALYETCFEHVAILLQSIPATAPSE